MNPLQQLKDQLESLQLQVNYLLNLPPNQWSQQDLKDMFNAKLQMGELRLQIRKLEVN